MAAVIPLFMSDAGWPEEMDLANDTLSQLKMAGNIDMDSNKIVNLTAGSADGDAVAYGQTPDFNGLTSDGNIVLSGGAELSGLPSTPTGDTYAASKAYVDSVATGLDVHASVKVRAQGNINLAAPGATIDGITMSVGDRFLADQQSTTTQDGIYEFQGAAVAATRTDDAQTGDGFAGVFLFVEEGTDADKGYVCTNNAGSDVVGTDDLVFTQFAGSESIPLATAGSGGGTVGRSTFDSDTGFAVDGSGVVTFGLAASAGLKWSGGDLAIEPNDFAGTGLEDDGADNLRLATQGNGIAGGGGTTLSVDPDSESGGNTQPVSVGANGVGLDVSAIAGTGLEADGSANLRLATQGNGIAGGGGTTLSVQAVAGEGIDVGAGGIEIDASDIAGLGLVENGVNAHVLDVEPDVTTGGDTKPVSATANGVGIDISSFDGDGLLADGSGNLDVQPDSTTGGDIKPVNVTANGVGLDVSSILGVGLSTDGDGLIDVDSAGDAPVLVKAMTSAEAFAIGDPVYPSATSGKVGKATADTDAKARVIGVAKEAATGADESKEIVFHGECDGAISGATPGAPYYLDTSGGTTATFGDIGAGERVIRCGFALTATVLWVKIDDFGKKAA